MFWGNLSSSPAGFIILKDSHVPVYGAPRARFKLFVGSFKNSIQIIPLFETYWTYFRDFSGLILSISLLISFAFCKDYCCSDNFSSSPNLYNRIKNTAAWRYTLNTTTIVLANLSTTYFLPKSFGFNTLMNLSGYSDI